MKDWLKQANEINEEFNNSKFGKISDSKIRQIDGARDGGCVGGQKNKLSGHMSNLGKKYGKINANHPNSIAAAKINGKKNVKNEFWKNLTKEQRIKGGKVAGNKRKLMSDFKDLPSIGGKKSAENRIERTIKKYKSILNLIENDIFITSDLRNACIKFGLKSDNQVWKKILKNVNLVQQIKKGENQFNPSIYKKLV